MPRTLRLDDLAFDVLACICAAVAETAALKTFSRVSRRVRAAAVPLLYRRVSFTIHMGESLPGRGGMTAGTLRAMACAGHLTVYIRALEVVVTSIAIGRLRSPSAVGLEDATGRAIALAQLLNTLPNVTELRVLLFDATRADVVESVFAPAFKRERVRLESVTVLEMSISHVCLRAACPRVSRLILRQEVNDGDDEESAFELWNLQPGNELVTDLSIPWSHFAPASAEIAASAPHISRLAIDGRLSLPTGVHHLVVFQNLTHLALPALQKLGVGYRLLGRSRVPDPHNVDDLDEEQQYTSFARLSEERRHAAEQQVKRIVRKVLPWVRVLRVRDKTWDFGRLKDGKDMDELDELGYMRVI